MGGRVLRGGEGEGGSGEDWSWVVVAKVDVRFWGLSFRRSQGLGVFMVDSCEKSEMV